MHYDTAVRRLRTIADDCDKLGALLDGEDGLVAVYASGPVLDHPGQDLEVVNIVLVMGLSPNELPWGVEPPGCTALAGLLRLDKVPVVRRWRPQERLVSNHEIRRPMPIWTREGAQEAALDALAERRAEPFRLAEPGENALAEQTSRELAMSAAHLRAVRDRYWDDSSWRRSHRRDGRYPEDHLWQAVDGYLDLLDAAASTHPQKRLS